MERWAETVWLVVVPSEWETLTVLLTVSLVLGRTSRTVSVRSSVHSG